VEIMSKSALLMNLPPDPDPDPVEDGTSTGATTAPAGIAAAPWLRWAALREAEDELASHAAAPHLRKRWTCDVCGKVMIAFFSEIDAHRERCGRPTAEDDERALPSEFGKGSRKLPSLQSEMAGGANLGLPREALGLGAGDAVRATEGKKTKPPDREDETSTDANAKPFECERCGLHGMFTPTEALKHKRTCGKDARA
jgi:hypothetical protein